MKTKNTRSVWLLLKPEVTIGVCVRNCEACIKDAIESILQQDFPHELMEVIFVDDGSEDRTLSIINSFVPKLDMDVKVFRHGWKGLGATRNVVVNNANGKYIIWVDGDMILSTDFVTKLVEFMNASPQVGIAKGRQSLEPNGNLLSTLEAGSRAVGRLVNYQSSKAKLKSLGTGGSIYRMKAVQQAGGFDEGLRGYGEDLDLELRIRAHGWYLYVVDVEFSDYERYGITWRDLWMRYWRRGYYAHYFLGKNRGFIKLNSMFPVVAFFTGFLYARRLFALTRRMGVFLLPLECFFKMSAWYVGFLENHV